MLAYRSNAIQKTCVCVCDDAYEGSTCATFVPRTGWQAFDAAEAFYKIRQYEMALPLYTLAATKFGHAPSQCRLGLIYTFGKGVAADDREAVRWLTLASNQGYAAAQSNLGYAYYSGKGVSKDEVLALALLRRSAGQGEMLGQFNIGTMFQGGLCGVAQNKTQALQWFSKAAKQGLAQAQHNVGSLLYQSADETAGSENKDRQALVWFQLASDGGSVKATEFLAVAQSRCTGTCRTEAEDLVKAFKPQDTCVASEFTREEYCGSKGTPTTVYVHDCDRSRSCAPQHATVMKLHHSDEATPVRMLTRVWVYAPVRMLSTGTTASRARAPALFLPVLEAASELAAGSSQGVFCRATRD